MLILFISNCTKKKEVIAPTPLITQEPQFTNWYPQEAALLSSQLDTYLKDAHNTLSSGIAHDSIRAIIVPHGHYTIAGICSAAAYQELLVWKSKERYEKNKNIKRVILLSPSHFFHLQGIALPPYTEYTTPLGTVAVDQEAIRTLGASTAFLTNKLAHGKEYGVELQLPFLQHCIETFSIVPLLVGHLSPAYYQNIIDQLRMITDNQTLIVVSSDFACYGQHQENELRKELVIPTLRATDSSVMQALINKDWHSLKKISSREASSVCGHETLSLLTALFSYPEYFTTQALLQCYYSSHQITSLFQEQKPITALSCVKNIFGQEAEKVINYASLIYFEGTTMPYFTPYEKIALKETAYQALAQSFMSLNNSTHQQDVYPAITPSLTLKAGCFVSLKKKDGSLRGCVGRLISTEPLYKTIREITQLAAFKDSRFIPVTEDEYQDLSLEITIITPPQKIKSAREFILGKQGIILKKNGHEAVLLPHIPVENKWNKKEALEQLAIQAGLSSDDWRSACSLETFESITIS